MFWGLLKFSVFLLIAIPIGYLGWRLWGWLLWNILPYGGMTEGWYRLYEKRKEERQNED